MTGSSRQSDEKLVDYFGIDLRLQELPLISQSVEWGYCLQYFQTKVDVKKDGFFLTLDLLSLNTRFRLLPNRHTYTSHTCTYIHTYIHTF